MKSKQIQIINFVILFVVFSFSVSLGLGQSKQIKICDLNAEGSGISSISGNEKGFGITKDFPSSKTKFKNDEPKVYSDVTKPLRITSKPRAEYTELARKNCVEGDVKIKITFRADGKIGKLKVVNALPFGLTKKSLEAAKLIKFEPEEKRGKPITVTKTLNYNFTIY